MALEITRRDENGISVLELTGRVVFGSEDGLLTDEIRNAIAQHKRQVVIDFGGVDKIDSAGLGTLLYARAELRNAEGGLALSNMHPALMRLLRRGRIDSVFNIFNTEEEAISSFTPERTFRQENGMSFGSYMPKVSAEHVY